MPTPDPEAERVAEAVLAAAGTKLGHYMPTTRAAILVAAGEALRAGRAVGADEPPPGLLMSIALRIDHGLACPGYYDQPLIAQEGVTHARRLEVAIQDAAKAWEEVTGRGFYRPEREADYAARAALAKASRPMTGGVATGADDMTGSRDLVACHTCGAPTQFRMLDSKPTSLKAKKATLRAIGVAADAGEDFTVLECRRCYGPAWVPAP